MLTEHTVAPIIEKLVVSRQTDRIAHVGGGRFRVIHIPMFGLVFPLCYIHKVLPLRYMSAESHHALPLC